MFSVRMVGVIGELQRQRDSILLQEYGRDRQARERAVAEAQQELDSAEGELDLAWAWHRLNEALVELAHLEARRRLAQRREALKEVAESKRRQGLPEVST
ncbi:MAG: hypothetical protein U0521_28625 [Anaerolineae bacterium]